MAQRKPVVDEIHEAMAELDPEAAAIVNAAKAHEAAAEKIRSRFTIRDRNGTHRSDPRDGRHDARPRGSRRTPSRTTPRRPRSSDDRPRAREGADGDRRGQATFVKWYKNKNHWYEDPSYRAQME